MQIEGRRLRAYYYPNNVREVYPWLQACFNVSSISTLYFQEYKRSREAAMRSIMFDEQGVMRSCFRDGELHYYTIQIVRWLLRRYDLSAAFSILRTITLGKSKPNRIIQRGLGRVFWRRSWKALVLAALLVVFLLAPTGEWMREWWPTLASKIKWMPLWWGRDPRAHIPSVNTW